jgi:hypothetical protein
LVVKVQKTIAQAGTIKPLRAEKQISYDYLAMIGEKPVHVDMF